MKFVPRKFSKADLEEVSLLSRLDHQNIVQLIGVGVCETATSVAIIMEYCQTDLYRVLRSRVASAPEFHSILEVMIQISDGINHIHERKIIHGDLKSPNILIHDGVIKITDIGFSVGTPRWSPPEWHCERVDFKARNNSKVDVYSSGLVFWEILQWHEVKRRVPFQQGETLGVRSIPTTLLESVRIAENAAPRPGRRLQASA